jgi:tRNA (guanine-N7-)-methyltransferase
VLELISKTEVCIDSLNERVDLPKIFGRKAPLHVDLGCGDGSFLCALAEANPEKNFLGIERLTGRVAKACRKAGPRRTGGRVDNVRFVCVESSYAVRFLLPEESVETFYLLFPDPWPKRRHQRRRIVTQDFLDAIARALHPNGLLRIATDQLDYFQQIERLARHVTEQSFSKLDWFNQSSFKFAFSDRCADLPITKFEKRFRDAGAPIYRLALRKVSRVR